MKYSVGQKVKIRSLEWYRDNVNRYGIIECGKYEFFEPMNEYCGKVVTIKRIDDDNYRIDVDKGAFCWTDEMIEGLVEEETKVGTASNPIEIKSNANCITQNEVDVIEKAKTYWDSIKDAWICPDGYIFKDENGNVINATKIVLEKKGKGYPKTYEECCKVMNYCCNPVATKTIHKEELIRKFQFLLLYRDAYWKIAGEEFNWDNALYYIYTNDYCNVIKSDDLTGRNCVLAFPDKASRDAFYENFKELIEKCKEWL